MKVHCKAKKYFLETKINVFFNMKDNNKIKFSPPAIHAVVVSHELHPKLATLLSRNCGTCSSFFTYCN